MGLAIFDIVVLFSGLPLNWKKGLILIDLLAIVFIGWVLRTLYIRKAERIAERARIIERSMSRDLNNVVEQVARDVEHQIDSIQNEM